MRNKAGQFIEGTSGNPLGRPRKDRGRLSFQLPLIENPSAGDLSSAIMKITVEAAAGKRTLSECECMIKILRQAMGAAHEIQRHNMAVKQSMIKGLQTMLRHIENQSRVLDLENSPDQLADLIVSAQQELDEFTKTITPTPS